MITAKFYKPASTLLATFLLACISSGLAANTDSQSIHAETAIEAYASDLHALALEAEPWITPILLYLAEDLGAQMSGLEFRFKSADSIARKIHSKMAAKDIASPVDASIRDALRYTMLLGDVPAGSHDTAVASMLSLFENVGHEVLTVKNYWQRGDDYSGINTTLKAPNGLAWELQFHTPASFDLKMSSHGIYEEVREPAITPERKQFLYDAAKAQWDVIEIPAGVLEPHSLHQREEIILRPRPERP